MRSEGIRSGPAGDGPSDRLRWNARYRRSAPDFTPHPLVAEAFAAGMVDGPVLELACGRSGSALALAEAGRRVVAVDVSDVALQQLATEAKRRGVAARVACVQADLETFVPPRGMFAFVLATRFWDAAVFDAAREAVSPGGLLGWEALALTDEDGSAVTSRFRVRHGTLGAALGPGWEVLLETATGETAGLRPHRSTRVLARALGGDVSPISRAVSAEVGRPLYRRGVDSVVLPGFSLMRRGWDRPTLDAWPHPSPP